MERDGSSPVLVPVVLRSSCSCLSLVGSSYLLDSVKELIPLLASASLNWVSVASNRSPD